MTSEGFPGGGAYVSQYLYYFDFEERRHRLGKEEGQVHSAVIGDSPRAEKFSYPDSRGKRPIQMLPPSASEEEIASLPR